MPADPKFAKLGNLSDRHRRTASPNAARTLPQERHKQQPSVNAQKAATMSSWMKTLSAGANKVGQAPAPQSNVAARRVGVAATASSAARKGCLQHPSTPSTSARRAHGLTGSLARRQRGRQAQALRRDLPLEGRHQILEGGLGRDLLRPLLPGRRERCQCLAREAARQDKGEGGEGPGEDRRAQQAQGAEGAGRRRQHARRGADRRSAAAHPDHGRARAARRVRVGVT